MCVTYNTFICTLSCLAGIFKFIGNSFLKQMKKALFQFPSHYVNLLSNGSNRIIRMERTWQPEITGKSLSGDGASTYEPEKTKDPIFTMKVACRWFHYRLF